MTALHYAADRGYGNLVAMLLRNGANPTVVDEEGQTALDYAKLCEHEEVIAMLCGGVPVDAAVE